MFLKAMEIATLCLLSHFALKVLNLEHTRLMLALFISKDSDTAEAREHLPKQFPHFSVTFPVELKDFRK